MMLRAAVNKVTLMRSVDRKRLWQFNGKNHIGAVSVSDTFYGKIRQNMKILNSYKRQETTMTNLMIIMFSVIFLCY